MCNGRWLCLTYCRFFYRIFWCSAQTLHTVCVIENWDWFFLFCDPPYLISDYDSVPYNIRSKYSAEGFAHDFCYISGRSSLFITPGRLCCKRIPENQKYCDYFFFFFNSVSSKSQILFRVPGRSVCIFCDSFHFLSFRRLIALWSLGF